MRIKSVLVLDDEESALLEARRLISRHVSGRVMCTRHPTKAIQLAEAHCFDLVMLDATLDYRGNQFGGLEIYRVLSGRYGHSSLLAYSQFIDDHVLERFGGHLNFLERGSLGDAWGVQLQQEAEKLRSLQTCFVAMPFSERFDSLYSIIKRSIEEAGYKPLRLDEQAFTSSIVDRIFLEIRRAKFVVFVATAMNPNVFLEAGYALALGKEVVTIAADVSELPFDIRTRNTIVHGNDDNKLYTALLDQLSRLTIVEHP